MSYQHDKYEIESGLEASFSDYVEQRDLKEEGDESSAAHSPDPSVNRLHNGAVASEPTSTDAPLSVGSRGSLRFQLPSVSPRVSVFSGSDGSEKHNLDTGTYGTPRSSNDPRETLETPLPASPRSSKSHGDSGWVRKLQARSSELRRLFDLDSTEQLMDDFMCALRKKVLLQGRLFAFERHLCFFSSLFGYQKAKVIPFSAVIEISKKKNVGFPNSILVVWDCPREGIKNEFFTSFLSREEAYKLIVGLWAQCSDRGRNMVTSTDLAPQSAAHMGNKRTGDLDKNSNKANSSASKTKDEPAVSLSRRWSKWVGIGFGNGGMDQEHDQREDLGESGGDRGRAEEGLGLGPEPSSLAPPPSESQQRAPGDAEIDRLGTAEAVHEFEELPPCSSPEALTAYFQGASDPAPPLPSNMQKILSIRLPTSTRGFFVAFLCPSSNFFVDFHASQGHRDIKVSQWQRHYKVGPVRDFRFVTPLKGWRMGPPQALCHQQHRFKVYAGEHLVFETSQVMSDIPYADHFRVEQRWDITTTLDDASSTDNRSGIEHCQLEVHVAVPFTKNTMWKRFIEKSVMDSTMEAFRMFKDLADRQLESVKTSHSSADLNAGVGATAKTGGGAKESVARPPSPFLEDLPMDGAEWDAFLNQVDPRWRNGLRALWKLYQTGGTGGGGSQSITMPRHRRRGSRARFVDFQKPYQNIAPGRKGAPLSSAGESVENRIIENRIEEDNQENAHGSFSFSAHQVSPPLQSPSPSSTAPTLKPKPTPFSSKWLWSPSTITVASVLALFVCLVQIAFIAVIKMESKRKISSAAFASFPVNPDGNPDGNSDGLEAMRSALLELSGSIAQQLKVIQRDTESVRQDVQRLVDALS